MKRNIVIALLLIPVAVLAYVILQLFVPAPIASPDLEVEIPEGTTFKQAMQILAKSHLVRDQHVLILLAKITGADRKIRAGYYLFKGTVNPLQVFQELRRGHIIEYEVTIVEGETLPQIGDKLAARGILSPDHFSSLVRDRGFLLSLNIDSPSLEGYLFPQTYRIPKGKPAESVLTIMVNTLRGQFSEALRERAKEIGWTENEVLTLASIIEREAATDEERPLISAVYHNRMRRGMPLQADPTAVYGVKSYRERITRTDLKNETQYNTYVISGLPPGPIASPGIKSIKAALYPSDVPYLYFVSRGDGSHYFSKTLPEHEAAIRTVKASRVPGQSPVLRSGEAGLPADGKTRKGNDS